MSHNCLFCGTDHSSMEPCKDYEEETILELSEEETAQTVAVIKTIATLINQTTATPCPGNCKGKAPLLRCNACTATHALTEAQRILNNAVRN